MHKEIIFECVFNDESCCWVNACPAAGTSGKDVGDFVVWWGVWEGGLKVRGCAVQRCGKASCSAEMSSVVMAVHALTRDVCPCTWCSSLAHAWSLPSPVTLQKSCSSSELPGQLKRSGRSPGVLNSISCYHTCHLILLPWPWTKQVQSFLTGNATIHWIVSPPLVSKWWFPALVVEILAIILQVCVFAFLTVEFHDPVLVALIHNVFQPLCTLFLSFPV